MTSQEGMQRTKDRLREIEWEPGKRVTVAYGPYRYGIVVECSEVGRQKAVFADGKEHPYFALVEILSGNGKWIERGSAVVPVLPDGRLIMVVEQRPAQARFAPPGVVTINGTDIDLCEFGPASSLEFPGGAVDPGEGLQAGFLRELVEETEVEEQTARVYIRRPLYPFGSEVPIEQHLVVAYLSGLSFEGFVKTDGGLKVLALNRSEVQQAIWAGVITSGQAALNQWAFYQEVELVRQDTGLLPAMKARGYLEVKEVHIKR